MAKRTTYGKAAAQLVAQRVDLVDEAGKAYEEVQRLERDYADRLAAAREVYAQRYRAAMEGGWSAAQLAEVNLSAPDGVRSSGRRTSSKRSRGGSGSATPPAAQVSEASGPVLGGQPGG